MTTGGHRRVLPYYRKQTLPDKPTVIEATMDHGEHTPSKVSMHYHILLRFISMYQRFSIRDRLNRSQYNSNNIKILLAAHPEKINTKHLF